jgi:molybdopterin molybdotransferase
MQSPIESSAKSNMISVREALETVLACCPSARQVSLDLRSVLGLVLAADVFADIDMPPFRKAMMDGYAVRSEDCSGADALLDIVGVVPAGKMPDFTVKTGQACKIMTGAPLPAGADAVQMVEKTEEVGNKVRIFDPVQPAQHVAATGEVMKEGQKVLAAGTVIDGPGSGLLACVGCAKVNVFAPPSVGILVTGDELVGMTEKPAGSQIRNSNGFALYAQTRTVGANPFDLGIAGDSKDELAASIAEGLNYDVLLVSGGVSMGDYDFVEDIFATAGVDMLFNSLNIKPGKPTVFGTKGSKLIFGLPGNPVSSSTVFEIIVRPALRKLMGFGQLEHLRVSARLLKDYTNRSRRETYHPAVTVWNEDGWETYPVSSKGSADVVAFAASNSYIVTKVSQQMFEKGELVDVVLREISWR